MKRRIVEGEKLSKAGYEMAQHFGIVKVEEVKKPLGSFSPKLIKNGKRKR